MNPRVIIGLPVFNGAQHLGRALESLLAQSYDDFLIVFVDNRSTDATAEIALRYAALDPRLVYERNPLQLGMVENWRRAFDLAIEKFGSFEYFCWGSDHDIWHPNWLEALVPELDANPALVAAFPIAGAMSADGAPMRSKRRYWDTSTTDDPVARVRWVARGMPVRAGNLAYALFRADAVQRCGIYPCALEPDRLLLARLCALGPMKQVTRELWTRRFFGIKPTRARQRARLFTGRTPSRAYLGTWLVHAAMLFHWAVIEGKARPECSRIQGVRLSGAYLVLAAAARANRVVLPRSRKSLRRRWKRTRPSLAPRRVAGKAFRWTKRQIQRGRRVAARVRDRASRDVR
jgi:glycosyltransferase involved in cell wall biosynthesis